MNNAEVAGRRLELARSYDYVATYRARSLGYETPQATTSMWRVLYMTWHYQFLRHYWSRPPSWRMAIRKFGGKRTLPDFCVVGPIKSGSSDLAVSLMLHPNVMTPLAKEVPLSLLHPERWRIYYPTEREKARHAERYGVALSPFLAPYLHSMELIYNLSRARPNTKIVLTLREPAQRVYSHWKWELFLTGRKRGRELPFLATFSAFVEAALAAYPERPMYSVCNFPALQTSIYWKTVRLWIESFGPQNVLVLDVADYFRDRDSVLRRICEFVGLPYVATPQSAERVNENPIVVPPADEPSLSKLRAFFSPANEELWKVIGKRFDW